MRRTGCRRQRVTGALTEMTRVPLATLSGPHGPSVSTNVGHCLMLSLGSESQTQTWKLQNEVCFPSFPINTGPLASVWQTVSFSKCVKGENGFQGTWAPSCRIQGCGWPLHAHLPQAPSIDTMHLQANASPVRNVPRPGYARKHTNLCFQVRIFTVLCSF